MRTFLILPLMAAMTLSFAAGACKPKPADKGDKPSAMTPDMTPSMTPAMPPAMTPAPGMRPVVARPAPKGIMARKDATTLARKFVDLLRAGKFTEARALYYPKLRKSFKEKDLKGVWDKLISQFGKFERFDKGAWVLPKGSLAFVFMPAWFQKGKFDLIVPIQGKEGVAGLRARFHEHHGEFSTPPYAKMKQIAEKKVVVGKNTAWELPGTYTTPAHGKQYPAVVLVHGSGPQDRDVTFGPNKVFRDIAWGLASEGIAVLRYDKRTRVHSKRMIKLKKKLTHKEEYVDDALAAMKMLASQQQVSKIFVVGHSDGAYTVPLILKRALTTSYAAKVAGGVLLAGPSRQLYENYLEQIKFLAKVRKVDKDPVVVLQIAAIEKAIQKVKEPNLSPDTPNRELPMGASAQYWLARRAYKHKAVAKALKLPLLVLNGQRDYQVTAKDFNGWKAALQGKKNAYFRMYPKLNHFFMGGKGAPNPREYFTPSHVAPRVILDLAWFISRQQLRKQ